MYVFVLFFLSQLNLNLYSQSLSENGSVLAIGPEGGWTDYEVGLFENCNFIPVSLGNRILRTDVACISLISILKDSIYRYLQNLGDVGDSILPQKRSQREDSLEQAEN